MQRNRCEPSFQERMDGIRDSFRETYQAFGDKSSGAWTAHDELVKAQAVFDGQDERGL